MPRQVANQYNGSELHILGAVYDVRVLIDAEDIEELSKYTWCYEQSKGLVYMTDLSMALPRKMKFKSARIYLRDYLLHIHGIDHHEFIWRRKSALDYRLDHNDLYETVR